MAKSSQAKIKANQKYSEKAYKRIVVYVKKDNVNGVTAFCDNYGYSRNNLFNEAVREKIERETGKTFDEFLKENQELKKNTEDTENTVNNPNNDV